MEEAGTRNQTCSQGGQSSCRYWEDDQSGRQNTVAEDMAIHRAANAARNLESGGSRETMEIYSM